MDVCLRLSPFFREFIDTSIIAETQPKKILVEFLRINHWIERWLDSVGGFDLSAYNHKHGGYRHLPLQRKVEQIKELRIALPHAEISVCEDVPEHYGYWKENVNPNKEDCCNLSM